MINTKEKAMGASAIGFGIKTKTKNGHQQLMDQRDKNKHGLKLMLRSMNKVYFAIVFEVQFRPDWRGNSITEWFLMASNCKGHAVERLSTGWINYESTMDDAITFDSSAEAEKFFLSQMPNATGFLKYFGNCPQPTGAFEIIELSPRFNFRPVGNQLKSCSETLISKTDGDNRKWSNC